MGFREVVPCAHSPEKKIFIRKCILAPCGLSKWPSRGSKYPCKLVTEVYGWRNPQSPLVI